MNRPRESGGLSGLWWDSDVSGLCRPSPHSETNRMLSNQTNRIRVKLDGPETRVKELYTSVKELYTRIKELYTRVKELYIRVKELYTRVKGTLY